MKLTIVLACLIAIAASASPPSGYRSLFPDYTTRSYPRYTPPTPPPLPTFVKPVVPRTGYEQNANILKFDNQANPDGSFLYYFDTDNGISARAEGSPRSFGGNPPVVPVVVQGSFGWTSPEGKPVSISYIADENGYQPQGDVLPTPPPVPPQIARALEYIARSARH